jgi:hypothetical protein
MSLLCVLWTKCTGRTHYGLVVSVRPSICLHDSTREPLDGLGWNLIMVLCHSGLPQNSTFKCPTISGNKWRMRKVVRWTDSRPMRCALVAKVGSIEVRICLFLMFTMVIQVMFGFFTSGFESLVLDICLSLNFESSNFEYGDCQVWNFGFWNFEKLWKF